MLADPGHYGRVIRDPSGNVARIVEARDASPEELAVAEINVGFYVFDAAELRRFLPTLTADNAQGEYYLTELVHRFLRAGDRVAAFLTADVEASMGVNSRVELAEVTAIMRRRLLERLMLDGVTIDDPSSTYVDWGVAVGRDSLIRPQTMLTGATSVGARCTVGPGCFLTDVTVDDGARDRLVAPGRLSRRAGLHRRSLRPRAARAPSSPRAPRRAASSRSRQAAWARAARCRT